MSVTIHQSPQNYTPSDNPINWVFSSDQTAQDNFSFLVEVYINGVLSANELVFPDNGIYARFDASSYASSNCNAPIISNDLYYDAGNTNNINIKVIERYGSPVIDHLSATSDIINFYKARLYDEDFVSYDSDDFLINGKWLTNFPSSENPLLRRTDEQYRLMVINNNENVPIKIELFDSTDTLVNDFLGFYTTEDFKISVFNLTPSVLIANTSLTQLDFDNSAYIVVGGFYGDPLIPLDNYRIDFNDNCEFDTSQRLHFLSELGSVESLSFDLLSRISGKVKSYSYEKGFGQWAGNEFNYTNENGRTVDYAKYSERMMMVESDWLRQDVQHWLGRNLIESPLIWIESGDSLLHRKINNSAWKDSYYENEMLFKEQITLSLPTKISMIV